MKYTRTFVDEIGYQLAPVVVTTEELEERLEPLYSKLRIPPGQLEAMTGIVERRWWEPGFSVAQGAARAAAKTLDAAGVNPREIDVLVYTGVCRENFEPATACQVAAELGVGSQAAVYDLSNACLGVLNGMVDVANRIELGQARAGLVVSCESAREINETIIDRMIEEGSMEFFSKSLATLTGGSGAVAVLLTDGSLGEIAHRHRFLGGANQVAAEHHSLCRWGVEKVLPRVLMPFMTTDSVAVLRHGVDLGLRTWRMFLDRLGWLSTEIDKVICHQVGAGHRDAILKVLGIERDKEFSTFEYLGNMGTVSLPLTAAMAAERGFLQAGDRVGWLGIGSGLNCLMLGLEW